MTYSLAPEARSDTVIASVFANGLVVSSWLYTLFFDSLSEGLRLNVAGALGVALVARCLLSWPDPAARVSSFLLACLILSPAFYFIFIMAPDQQNLTLYAGSTLRLQTCFAVLIYFAHEKSIVSPNLGALICLSVVVIGLYVALTGDALDYAGILRPATFTGGKEGVHSSGYVATAALLGAVTLWRLGRLRTAYFLPVGIPLLGLVVAYQVRTTWVMVLTFGFVSLLVNRRATGRDLSVPLFFLANTLLLVLAAGLSSDIDAAEFSSGRTAVFHERIDMIVSRAPRELLMGTGPGSEVLASDAWWWAPKNSHNSFIDVTIQIGFLGLVLLLCVAAVTMRVADDVRLPLIAAFFVSSIISNGLLSRPWIAVLFLAYGLVKPSAQQR